MGKRVEERYVQEWAEIEKRFPNSSAAFDRDLGDPWLDDRDGPRFDQYGTVLKVFAGACAEVGHTGPWSSAYYEPDLERWIIQTDERRGDPVPKAVTPSLPRRSS